MVARRNVSGSSAVDPVEVDVADYPVRVVALYAERPEQKREVLSARVVRKLEGSVVVNNVKNANAGEGYNALTDEYVNMVDAGILDPVKVSRSALQNANSIAATLLTTESAVSIIKEKEPPMPAGGAGMGMM